MSKEKSNRWARRWVLIAIAFALAVVLGVSLGGCRATAPTKKSSGSKPTYTIRIPNSPYFDPTAIAEAKGFFKEQGITIERTGQSLGGPDAITQVVSRGVDISGAAAEPIINAIASGVKIKGIASGPEYIEEMPHMRWFSLKDSGITTAKDIIGKKIGVDTLGDCSEFTQYKHFEVEGIKDYKGKVEFVVIPPAQLEQALTQRQVDVVILHQPFQGKAKKNPKFFHLFTDLHATGKAYPYPNFFTTEKLIKEKRDLVRAFVAAIAKTADWNNAHHEEANRIVAPKIGVPPEMVQYMEGQHWGEHALITEKGTQMILDLLIGGDSLKKDQVKATDVYTNEFNPFD